MSGIAGVYRPGGTVDEGELDGMVDWQRPRGPDGEGRWVDGSAALAHGLLATTPEAAPSQQPLNRAGLVATADIRLDNRPELREQLSVPMEAPDVALVCAAYDRWGVRCPEHLLGAFAFAVWDGERERLFLARDHMGIKPLAYAETDDGVVFASEPAAVLQHNAVPVEVDEQWIAEFLLGYFEDTEATVYSSIRRLPPAHTLVVDDDGVKLDRYWELTIDPERVPDSDEECINRFRELFWEAVRCRLRGADPGGVLLSGGLDSSSIACTGAELQDGPIHTFSAYSDEVSESDEREYIDAVLDTTGFESHIVCLDGVSPLVDSELLFKRHGGPVRASNHYLHWELFRMAHEQDVQVVLDGFQGDTVVSHGFERLPMLARRGRWLTLIREIDALARQIDRFSRRNRLRRAIGYPLRLSGRIVGNMSNDRISGEDRGLLDPEFANRIEPPSLEDDTTSQETSPDDHIAQLRSGGVTYSIEEVERTAASFGVEPRFPFLDKRLVTYCVSLPVDLKLREGWPRYVLREAMEGILPPAVRNRGTKGQYGDIVVRALQTQEAAKLESLSEPDLEPLVKYIDRTWLRNEIERLLVDGGDRFEVWRILSLTEWMRYWDRLHSATEPDGPTPCLNIESERSSTHKNS